MFKYLLKWFLFVFYFSFLLLCVLLASAISVVLCVCVLCFFVDFLFLLNNVLRFFFVFYSFATVANVYYIVITYIERCMYALLCVCVSVCECT